MARSAHWRGRGHRTVSGFARTWRDRRSSIWQVWAVPPRLLLSERRQPYLPWPKTQGLLERLAACLGPLC